MAFNKTQINQLHILLLVNVENSSNSNSENMLLLLVKSILPYESNMIIKVFKNILLLLLVKN